MNKGETDKLVKGAFLLTLAGLISKILSAGYRIPLQNLTGDLGFYIYQQVYPLLGIAIVLALYGFPSAISRSLVHLKSEGKEISLANFYWPVFLILLGINGVLFLLIYCNASTIANWAGDIQLEKTYQNAAFLFLFIPFLALLRGAFQGNNDMKPTAYSQVGEQLTRVFLIILAAILVVLHDLDIYYIGEFAGIASIGGFLTAIFLLLFFFGRNKPSLGTRVETPWKHYFKTVFIFGIVAALNHMILLVIQFADAFTLVPNLLSHGLSKLDAMKDKGIFDRGQPLIQLGTVLGSSFALALIPNISKQNMEKNPAAFYRSIQGALAFSFYLAAGATLGLIMIFPEVNVLLYENDSGTKTLQILVMSILLCSIVITATSILQGLGYMKRTAGFIVVAVLVKWIANDTLVPLWGITGSALATVFSLCVLGIAAVFELKRKLPNLEFFGNINWSAFLKASIGMILYIIVMDYFFASNALFSRIRLLIYVVFISITGGVLYIILLLRCRAFSKEELSMLPYPLFFIRLHKERK